jgi:pimeloyl-ACP methyl ester carboxylesterase
MVEIYKSAAGKAAVESLYERVLQHWPVPFEQITVPTALGNTFVITGGPSAGWPVVLLHGSGTNSSSWIRDVAVWAQRYRVYAVDMIGEPGFSAPARPPLTSEAYAEWLGEVWAKLGLTRASVVGISLGGWLALDYAIRRPQRVASLSLLAPSGVGRQNPATLVRLAMLRLLGSWGLRKSFQLIAGEAKVPSALSDRLVMVFRHFRPRLERIPVRSDAELAALTMPVQLILGAKDVLLRSAETRARMERFVQRLSLEYLENEGHILTPQTDVIAEFVSSVAESSCPEEHLVIQKQKGKTASLSSAETRVD